MASYTTWLLKSVPLCRRMELYWTSFWTTFLVLVIGSVTVIFIVLIYSGLFYRCKIHCTFPASLPTKTAYRCFVGPYKNCAGVFWKLNALMPKSRLFGIYYDDPDTVSPEKTRYIVGACLADDGSDMEQEEMLEDKGYTIHTLPKCSRALVAEFPYRNTLSIYLGTWKVYPALEKYIKDNDLKTVGPFMEIYLQDCIQFVAIMDNNEKFYHLIKDLVVDDVVVTKKAL